MRKFWQKFRKFSRSIAISGGDIPQNFEPGGRVPTIPPGGDAHASSYPRDMGSESHSCAAALHLHNCLWLQRRFADQLNGSLNSLYVYWGVSLLQKFSGCVQEQKFTHYLTYL